MRTGFGPQAVLCPPLAQIIPNFFPSVTNNFSVFAVKIGHFNDITFFYICNKRLSFTVKIKLTPVPRLQWSVFFFFCSSSVVLFATNAGARGGRRRTWPRTRRTSMQTSRVTAGNCFQIFFYSFSISMIIKSLSKILKMSDSFNNFGN
jgi:hypothetical protein